jgi:hypothetical protein
MTIKAFEVSNEDHITEKTRPTVIQFTSAGSEDNKRMPTNTFSRNTNIVNCTINFTSNTIQTDSKLTKDNKKSITYYGSFPERKMANLDFSE